MPELPRRGRRLPWEPRRVPHAGRRYQDKRYKTRRWQRLRLVILQRAPVCAACERAAATVVDHITPVRWDPARFYDATNLQGLCRSCHDRKSATTDKQPPPGQLPDPQGGGQKF